jgi:cytochrome b subunit of formate dehydrogenase
VINRKDFTDAVDNLKYYFGLTDHPARCDRYDYKQKFEYWGVIVGGLLMIGTGFVLWFPAFIARYLPGEFIPAAKAAHTNEALLAFLVIIVWHMYNAVFSPEVFPLDTAIFTGRISAKRMKHEHPLEYERITGEFQENIFPEGESEIQQESDLSP